MTNAVKCLLFAAMLGIFAAPSARAASFPWFPFPPTPPSHPSKPEKAPEIDPALAASGLALLSGSLVVLRARRKK